MKVLIVEGCENKKTVTDSAWPLAEFGIEYEIVNLDLCRFYDENLNLYWPPVKWQIPGLCRLQRRLKVYIDIIKRKYDVIDIHFPRPRLVVLVLLSYFMRIPVVLSFMGSDIFFEKRMNYKLWHRILLRLILKTAVFYIVRTPRMEEKLTELLSGLTPDKYTVIPWWVDKNIFNPDRIDNSLKEKFHIRDEDIVLLSPRSIVPFYNILTIVEAFANACRQGFTSKLLLTGETADPEYRARIEAYIKDNDLSAAVKFTGSISYEDMAYYYNLADICIALPPSDALPRSVMEGFCCHTPHILPRLQNYKDIWPHRAVLYVDDYNDSEEIAAVLAGLDKITIKALQVNAAKEAASITDKREPTKLLIDIYRELCRDEKKR